jgi:hypothetical protein
LLGRPSIRLPQPLPATRAFLGELEAAKIVTSARFTGSRSVTVRLMAADGTTVLREKTLAITAS